MTFIRASSVSTVGVNIAVVDKSIAKCFDLTFVDVGTGDAITFVSDVASADKRTVSISAAGVGITVV